MIKAAGRAFTLIELLVVMGIIAMVLALAGPAIVSIFHSSTIRAATDILRSAVSKTRSTAVSSRRSCTIDIRNSPDGHFTEKVSTSVLHTSDDFESYGLQLDTDEKEWLVWAELSDEFTERWRFEPDRDPDRDGVIAADNADELGWEVRSGRTRELWIGKVRSAKVKSASGELFSGSAYAWNVNSGTPPEPGEDSETIVIARFYVRQVTGPRGEWGFGLVSNFVLTDTERCGYRLAVRGQTSEEGWNSFCKVSIEKIWNPANPKSDNFYEATDLDTSDDMVPSRDLDPFDRRESAAVTPGVWYWMKFSVKRENKVVTGAGKIWVEGAPEPTSWTVGPVTDAWPETDLKDSFRAGGDPVAGGFCGVWCAGVQAAVDDFSVDWQNTWVLPKGILMQPNEYDPEEQRLVPLERYKPGSLPLSYRPDGTATSDRMVLLVITNISSSNKRVVQIDPNTGRVESADALVIERKPVPY